MAKFIESNRGKRMLVFENYKFSFAYTKLDGTMRWKCVIRSCSIKLYTNENDKILKNENDSNIYHNHNPYETKIIDRQIINTSCKRKATEEIFVRPKKNYF
ncbi:FLYWCH-type domain-containing protein [Aphis craccivora]|uniref:FLYWCH-type domain-containing protein n=1 Tax=Aphis craccivora TaxID=307492 RepID=A0A6G0YM58_APHCR|nr:FLYWCH-type domain-containing protein [Aphis craccivora]